MLPQRAARDVVKEIEENLTWGRLADKVAELNGSWPSSSSSASHLPLGGAELRGGDALRLVPVPVLRYLALAILVALQGPLIVMSQNRQTMKGPPRRRPTSA